MRFTTYLLVILLAGRVSFAECNWESTDKIVEASLTDNETKVQFQFTNTGSKAVTIDEVRSSCGCTTASVVSKVVGPGEKGQIDFAVKLGKAVGLGTKLAAVTIIDGDQKMPPVELKMRIKLPDPLAISPPFVSWDKGDKPSSKTIHVVSNLKVPFNILSVESPFKQIETSIVTVEAGSKYDITVTSTSTDKRFFGTLVIHTDVPSNGVEKQFEFDAAIN